MAKTAAPRERESDADRKPWKRYLLIGAPLVVAAVVLVLVFLPEIRVRGWINRLSSADGRVRREQIEALEGAEDRELVNRLLLEAVTDDDRTISVRLTCAGLLIKRQRLARLERELRTGSLHTRGVVLKALSRERFFQSTYVDDPSYRARETVAAWLARDGDLTRSHAVQLAITMSMDDSMPLIRPLIAQPDAANVHPSARRELLIAAVAAVENFKDCESVPAVASLAEQDKDFMVRLRAMQAVDRTTFRDARAPACPGAIDEARMSRLVTGALDDAEHTVRMGAMLILGRKTEWAVDVAGRIESILDGDGNSAERRQALETLVRIGQPAFLERFPRYFLDRSAEVRSSAVRAAGAVESVPLFSCLIGLLEDETESQLLFGNAVAGLREGAGAWVGLPEAQQVKSGRDRAGFQRDLQALFRTGEMDSLSRGAWAVTWFRWWCDHLELTAEQTEQAVAARKEFWTAKEARDVSAAQSALDGLAFDAPGLFTYERAWLEVREP